MMMTEDQQRYNRLFRDKFKRTMELGFHYFDEERWKEKKEELISAFSAPRIVQNLKKAHVDSCWIWASALGVNFYNNPGDNLGHSHFSLNGRDLMMELSQELRKAGISFLMYNHVNVNNDYTRHNPGGLARTADGKPADGHICFNCEDYRNLLAKKCVELVDRYNPDGLFFDMINYHFSETTCYCETCRSLFEQKFGFQIPEKLEWDYKTRCFLEFRYNSNKLIAVKLRDAIREKHPDKIILFNFHGQVPFGWKPAFRPVSHGILSDATLYEDFGTRLHQLYPSILTAFAAGIRPGFCYGGLTDRFLYGYGDFSLRPKADLLWNLYTIKLRGGNALIIDKLRHDYSMEPHVCERIGEAYKELAKREHLFEYERTREAGLYFSVRSRDMYGKEDPSRYNRHIIGAYRALTELHFQTDIIFDEEVTLEQLLKYPVIYLANTAVLTDDEVEIIRKYVSHGGCLIATAETGLYDIDCRFLN